MSLDTLKDALIHELQDILSAENQITEALPDMIDAAEDSQLKQAFKDHLEETAGQIQRVEKALRSLGGEVETHKCKAMEGLIKEGKELLKEDADADVKDAMLIAAAQKVEHYEIASYGTVCTWCETLGEHEALELLKQNIDQEESADLKLTRLAKGEINADAVA